MSALSARLAAALAAVAAAVFLTSCTSAAGDTVADDHAEHTQSGQDDAADGVQQAHNSDDIAFAQNMFPHHKQALELVDLARGRSSDPALHELASAIGAAQGPEMGELADMLRSWGQDPDAVGAHTGHDAAMPGMVDEAAVSRLESLNGSEFDTLWLESMISHHQGAVEMAEAEIANGENADAKALAERIVETQEAEIEQMNQMLGRS